MREGGRENEREGREAGDSEMAGTMVSGVTLTEELLRLCRDAGADEDVRHKLNAED